MRQEEPGRGDPIEPLDGHKIIPFGPDRSSDRLGWGSVEAARFRVAPASECSTLAHTHHRLVLFARPTEELELLYEGVKRHVPPPVGSISLVPAGTPALWRWSGRREGSLHIFLKPSLVEQVAAEAFDLDLDLDPARTTVPPLDGLDLPHLRAAMGAVDAELTAGGPGGPLAAESLANVVAVHLIRHVVAPRRTARRPDGALPRSRLRAVVEYIEGHLDASPTLEQMAAVAGVSTYHFAHQFKRATGLPPYQYVIMRRVERAEQLLRAGTDLPLAEIAARAGFADQSLFCRHFKRLVGVTPGRFRMHTRIS
jgi:AraC family transcriptional regulator